MSDERNPIFPAIGAYAVTASDSVDFLDTDKGCRALVVTTAGAYKITTDQDEDVTIQIAAGVPFPIKAKRVWSTGSVSTSGIVALY